MKRWIAETEPDGDQGARRTKVIEPQQRIWVFVCPNNPSHFYAAPGWEPDNVSLYEPHERRSSNDGAKVEVGPRINCPYCHVPRVPHLVKELIPFRDDKKDKKIQLPSGPI